MARRVFFSFHFDRDAWRANQVRNCNVVHGCDVAGYFDHSEYTNARLRGDGAIKAMIDRHLFGTSVTVVLIGLQTALRPWVRYEVAESVKRGNGLIGMRINHLEDQFGRTDAPGPVPSVPPFTSFPIYNWAHNPRWFAGLIEEAANRGTTDPVVRALQSFLRR